MDSQNNEDDFELKGIELFTLQKSSIKDSKDRLHIQEKAQFFNLTDKVISKVLHIYPYVNEQFSSLPESKYKKLPTIFSICSGNDQGSCAIGYSNGEIHMITGLTRISVQFDFDSILGLRMHSVKPTTLLALNGKGHLYYIHSSTGKQLSEIIVGNPDEQAARCMDLNKFSDKFAVAYKNGVIEVFDDNTQSKDLVLDNGCIYSMGHVNQIHGLAFDKKDPNLLISGGRDKRVILWDIRKQKAVQMTSGPYILGESIDAKDGLIIAGDYNMPGNLYVFDIRKIKEPVNIIETNTNIYSSRFTKKENSNLLVVGGYKQHNLQLYKDFEKCSEAGFSDHVFACDFNRTGRTLVYGSNDGGVRFCDIRDK